MQPLIDFVAAVLPEHGETFARDYLRRAFEGLDMNEAFNATDIMTWPRTRTATVDRRRAVG